MSAFDKQQDRYWEGHRDGMADARDRWLPQVQELKRLRELHANQVKRIARLIELEDLARAVVSGWSTGEDLAGPMNRLRAYLKKGQK